MLTMFLALVALGPWPGPSACGGGQSRSSRRKLPKHSSVRQPEVFQDSQTFFPVIDFFPGMEVLYRQHLLGGNGVEPEAVFRRRHAIDSLKAAGKIAVIGKTGFVANFDHGLFGQGDQLPGVVEANGVDVVLKGLVHGIPDKAGQKAQRAVFRLGKICQPDLVGKVFINKLDQPCEPGIALFGVDLLLGGHGVAGHEFQKPVQNQAALTHAEKLGMGFLSKTHPGSIQHGLLQPAAILLWHAVRQSDFVGVHMGSGRESSGRDLQAQKGAGFLHFMKLMGPVGREQNQFSGVDLIFFLCAGDIQWSIQHPEKLPLWMKVGRAVLHRVDKNPHAINLVLRNNFQFFHG